MKRLALLALTLLLANAAKAVSDPIGAPTQDIEKVSFSTSSSDVQKSTTPLGSPFYRHLAYDFDIPIKELVKFERKGFGRIEIVEMILVANSMDKPLKDIGNRRIKDHVSMESLVKEAGLNYREVAKVAREIKVEIESRGDKELPMAVYDVSTSTEIAIATEKEIKKKQKEKKK